MKQLQINPAFPVGGYHRKLLRVDLTQGVIQTEEITPELLRTYIGGTGLRNHLPC